MEHNEDVAVEQISDYLEGKTIALCVTGGIAAIETPKIARHLRRFGANVRAYMTHTAQSFVGEAALEWGTGQPVRTKLTGSAEHICLEDLILIAPATLNVINKISAGIADDPITTLVASALGKKTPVLLAPTMHLSMYNNPILQKNLANAQEYGIHIIHPRLSEGKAKIPSSKTITANVSRMLSASRLKGKDLLITGGPAPGKVDDVRMITNIFRGTLAVQIADQAYHRGANVTLLLGKTGVEVPEYLRPVYHNDFYNYRDNVFAALQKPYDAAIFSAAVADYVPVNYTPGKISSDGGLDNIALKQTPKIIKEVRQQYPDLFMATFKFESHVTKERLLEIAQSRVAEGYQLVVANRSEEMTTSHNAYIVGPYGVISQPSSKTDIAKKLLDEIETRAIPAKPLY